MVGWFSSIFGPKEKKIEAAPSPMKELVMSEFISILEKRIGDKNSSIEPAVKGMHKRLTESSSQFSDSLKSLDGAVAHDRVDDAILNIAKSYKSTVIKSFNTMFIEIGKDVDYDLESFSKYLDKCMSSKSEAEEKSFMYVKPLKEVFPPETGKVIKSYENLNRSMLEISSTLSSKRADFKPLTDMLSAARGLESQISKTRETELQMSQLKSEVESLVAEKERTEANISNLLNSGAWLELQAWIQEAESISRKMDETLSAAVQTISTLSRAMKRLDKMSFDDPEFLSLYISDPDEAFVRDADQTMISKIISRIKEGLMKGTLEIGGKDADKILRSLADIESNKTLSLLRTDYRALDDSLKSIREKIDSSEVQKTKAHYESSIKSIDSRIANAESNLETLNSALVKLKDKSNGILAGLQSSARETFGENFILKI